MSKQVKCANCGNWNAEGLKHCENCQTDLTVKVSSAEVSGGGNNYKEFVGKLKGQSDWIDKFFIKAKNGNVFMKGLAYFLQFMWMVYFSLLLFVAWLVFIVAG